MEHIFSTIFPYIWKFLMELNSRELMHKIFYVVRYMFNL